MANGPARTLKAVFNEGDANILPSAAQGLLGYALQNITAFYKGAVASNKVILPEGMKARTGLEAYVTAGTVTGRFSYDPDGTPATTNFSVDPNGNLIFFATDAVTAVEVYYIPAQGEIIEETVAVASNVGLLGGGRTALVLLSATAVAGTLPGAKTSVARAATPATTQAAINLTGLGIVFATADAVTLATVRYIAAPTVGGGVSPNSVAQALAADSTML